MSGQTRITFLGSGPSSGVPGVGIGWGRCDPSNPKNRRLRQSILLDMDTKRFLVDTSPDLREQLLLHDVNALDAVLFTHAHADHLHGIDDLRGINKAMKMPLPVFADPKTHEQIAARFPYTLIPLKPDDKKLFTRPVLDMTEFAPGEDIDVSGVTVGTFPQDHGFSGTVGFDFDGVVYSTDVKAVSDDVLARLRDAELDVWVIGVFRWEPHWTHAHVDLAMQWIDFVKPRRAVLTHLGVDVDYDELRTFLPDEISPAFDGMTIEIDGRGGEIRISD